MILKKGISIFLLMMLWGIGGGESLVWAAASPAAPAPPGSSREKGVPAGTPAEGGGPGGELLLTDGEKRWIASHPLIVAGALTDWPPYDFVEGGRAVGFANDYLRLLARKAGLELTFVHGYTWEELLEKMRDGEVDLLPCVATQEGRESFLRAGSPYFEGMPALVVREGEEGIDFLEDLAGKRLAQVPGYSVNPFIEREHPQIQGVPAASPLEALLLVSQGHADAYLDSMGVVNYVRRENLIPGLRIANAAFPFGRWVCRVAAGVEEERLLGILEKAAVSVTFREREGIKDRWLGAARPLSGGRPLSPEEKAWTSGLGTLRMGITASWAPMEFVGEEGRHQGITLEYARIMIEKLGITVEMVSRPWHEILEMTKRGDIDLLPGLNETPDRRKYLRFTRPYLKIPIVIATRVGAPYYPDPGSLAGVTVGVGEGYAEHMKLLSDYPLLRLKGYPTVEAAVMGLGEGEVDAVVANSAVFVYYRNRHGLSRTVHINNTTPYVDNLAVGVRPGLARLLPLLERVLADISPDERALIMDKWGNLPVHRLPDRRMVRRVAGVLLAVLSAVLLWTWKMGKEVKKRRKVEAHLRERETVLRQMSDNVDAVSWIASAREMTPLYISASYERLTGRPRDSLVGRPLSWLMHIHPEDRDRMRESYERLLESGGMEAEYRRMDSGGGFMWLEERCSTLPLEGDGEPRVVGISQDITRRKKADEALSAYAETQVVLLREVNHRVKNNLTAIIGMLHMEAEKSGEGGPSHEQLHSLGKMEARISSLLAVHGALSSTRWQPLPIGELCREVISRTLVGIVGWGNFTLEIDPSDARVPATRPTTWPWC